MHHQLAELRDAERAFELYCFDRRARALNSSSLDLSGLLLSLSHPELLEKATLVWADMVKAQHLPGLHVIDAFIMSNVARSWHESAFSAFLYAIENGCQPSIHACTALIHSTCEEAPSLAEMAFAAFVSMRDAAMPLADEVTERLALACANYGTIDQACEVCAMVPGSAERLLARLEAEPRGEAADEPQCAHATAGERRDIRKGRKLAAEHTAGGKYRCPDCGACFDTWGGQGGCREHVIAAGHADAGNTKGLQQRCMPINQHKSSGTGIPTEQAELPGQPRHAETGAPTLPSASCAGGARGEEDYSALAARADDLSRPTGAGLGSNQSVQHDEPLFVFSPDYERPRSPRITSGRGHGMLLKLGWVEGRPLGRSAGGIVEPVRALGRKPRSKKGLGASRSDVVVDGCGGVTGVVTCRAASRAAS